MRVVSRRGMMERVHFVAPDADRLGGEVRNFLKYVNGGGNDLPWLVRAAIAHLWFVAIHPFDDGNGRLTRTLTDMLLTRADGMPHRFYSMSAEILLNRNEYYTVLENTTTKM